MTATITSTLRVLVIDDHRSYAEALSLAISIQPGFESIGSVPDVETAIQKVLAERPDVVVIDWQLPLVDGVEGTITGVVYVALTALRLVFFTLRKAAPDVDANHFRGMPSTVGGVLALSSAILWAEQPALVAFVAGMAVVWMVSFDAGFLHLGRAVFALAPAERSRVVVAVVVLMVFALVAGPKALATATLCAALTYAAGPSAQAFVDAVAASVNAAVNAAVIHRRSPSPSPRS
jgi:hypothetical protein